MKETSPYRTALLSDACSPEHFTRVASDKLRELRLWFHDLEQHRDCLSLREKMTCTSPLERLSTHLGMLSRIEMKFLSHITGRCSPRGSLNR
ncbi:hypothetical protein J6590_032252 [Homalodisca vitripennis]|nr:hypothetical protein J6590_032252 [Homalodisca vitripennis]